MPCALASRITLASNNVAECACSHDDVHEFIVQRGENYKVFGAWKVYANVEQALATFDAYRACTQYFTFVYQQGCSLAQLAQATR